MMILLRFFLLFLKKIAKFIELLNPKFLLKKSRKTPRNSFGKLLVIPLRIMYNKYYYFS